MYARPDKRIVQLRTAPWMVRKEIGPKGNGKKEARFLKIELLLVAMSLSLDSFPQVSDAFI